MKKIKIFLMMIALMAVSLTTLTVTHAKEKPCATYTITCDGASIHGTVCGHTAGEVVEKVVAIIHILCY